MSKSFRDLIVWQKSRDLTIVIYKITNNFPQSELYGLTSQMRRAAISISSNIAESYNRFHNKEKKQFLAVAFGSGSELESQLEIAKILFSKIDYEEAGDLLEEVMKILNSFLNK
ncbi:MAG: 23S ribosomal protein [Candidatus Jorgensenbacteria bacterium GW2011_GWA1_48_11]|uniref:23S ribosomal protein n=1 Tax=Candidatus Jorgensenbacteria bacterium GW2011_GWA1_48_11 TaxID=1618660 RepID=A0A0G1UC26_9BACT|nr:MAG: 23S ribosomal protein [Candidatus Jorgensenbacteria bacterium GW2011_GWA1_48_11]KKW12197.1 MAG: 23S ribosomal protein [Candidatus Jorgensenbacteria bacterium GW2011_GWB1_49_9]